jgi:hypothetical protein
VAVGEPSSSYSDVFHTARYRRKNDRVGRRSELPVHLRRPVITDAAELAASSVIPWVAATMLGTSRPIRE